MERLAVASVRSPLPVDFAFPMLSVCCNVCIVCCNVTYSDENEFVDSLMC